MNYKMMGRFMGRILLVEAAFMLPALLIGAYCKEDDAVKGFILGIGVTVLLAVGLLQLCRGAGKGFHAKEGLVCVG